MNKMIGFSKERVLACMGPPTKQATVGATEVWSYESGDNFTAASYGNGTVRQHDPPLHGQRHDDQWRRERDELSRPDRWAADAE
jgi:hypothetical protein